MCTGALTIQANIKVLATSFTDCPFTPHTVVKVAVKHHKNYISTVCAHIT